MPIYPVHCEACGHSEDVLLAVGEELAACSRCGVVNRRGFSGRVFCRWAKWSDPKNDDGRAEYEHWYRSDEVQAKIKTGELVHKGGVSVPDSREGAAASSDSQTAILGDPYRRSYAIR